MNPNRCPVVTADFEIIHRYLSGLPLEELIAQTEDIFAFLSPGEQNSYNINRFCTSYTDIDGRIQFVRTLIENAVIATVHIPFNYNRDERLINLLRPKQYEYFLPIAKELKEEGAALTDDLETPLSNITVTNPRWEHVDESRKNEAPTVARVGDTIALLVDVSEYPEGAPVTFDIFDKTREPAMRIETERGKNEGGIARIEWVVSDPDEQGAALKLEFEGSARSKSSGRVPIDLSNAVYQVELVDDEGNKLEGVKVVFTVAGEETEVLTDNEGVAKHPAKDPAVKADVQVFWEDSGEEGANEGAVVSSGASEETSKKKGFEVVLVDDKEEPLKGIEVHFSIADGEPLSVVTDDQGKATISTEAAGAAEKAEVKVVWKE